MMRHPTSQKLNPLGQHQSSWIWGRHLVWETLQSAVWPILELWLADDLDEAEMRDFQLVAQSARIPIQRASRKSFVSKCRGEDHQGYAARMAEFPYRTLDSVLEETTVRWPFFVLLDRIQDPFNFGTMLRSAEVFGAQGIVIGSREQTGVTSQVARSSVGAVNRLPIVRVDDLTATARQLQQQKVVILGASEKAEQTLCEFDLRQPVAFVIGNEGRGISPELAACCDATVRIPQHGTINSLNAAAALAIFCYEIRRQQAIEM
ncbi:MAG: putative TrmH family tRNA/rRNA methyltransferase [Planctomycetaceae bacterium]|nr:putative TrmH family tRNA/rRNA methyltransferase [Planctomycetaceae bacterium]